MKKPKTKGYFLIIVGIAMGIMETVDGLQKFKERYDENKVAREQFLEDQLNTKKEEA